MAPVLVEVRLFAVLISPLLVAGSTGELEARSGTKSDRSEVGLFKVADLLGLSIRTKY